MDYFEEYHEQHVQATELVDNYNLLEWKHLEKP